MTSTYQKSLFIVDTVPKITADCQKSSSRNGSSGSLTSKTLFFNWTAGWHHLTALENTNVGPWNTKGPYCTNFQYLKGSDRSLISQLKTWKSTLFFHSVFYCSQKHFRLEHDLQLTCVNVRLCTWSCWLYIFLKLLKQYNNTLMVQY